MKNFMIFYLMFMIGCSSRNQELAVQTHKNEVELWYLNRVNELKSESGWLNLAGLFWLEGKYNFQNFGSDSTNDLVFPTGKIPGKVGYMGLGMGVGQEGLVQMTILNPAVEIVIDGTPLSSYRDGGPPEKNTVYLHSQSDSSAASVASYGPLQWTVIKRSDKIGVRLRDLDSENVKNFKGIERYPVDYSWKTKAKFEPAALEETIDITNVLGQTTATPLAGTLVFDVDGKEQRLAATAEGDKLFVVFGDATNGKETYGAGRFVYVDVPDATGFAVIDFNKSYNPPCAFTEFATCPLPPKQNVLAVAITAGEKDYHSHENGK